MFDDEEALMKTLRSVTVVAAAALAFTGLSACSGLSTQDRNTAIGAGAGAIGGSVLTGGSTGGTLGGAAVGGVIGHEVSKPKK